MVSLTTPSPPSTDVEFGDRKPGVVQSRDAGKYTAEEKRVVRKLDRNVISLVSVLYLLSFLDRSNIGNAKTAGMQKDLHLTSDGYEWLLTIFYISYITFEWLVLMWKVLPPHYWATLVVFSWGVLATCQAAVQSWKGEMAIRFLLGVAEAGYGPGIVYYLSFFYLRHEVGFRCGMFLSAAPLASTFAGALAYGITSGHAKIASWRLLFLVEGLPTICMAAVAFFFLPDSAESAKFLTAEEKSIAKARGVRQVGDQVRIGGVDWKDIGHTLMDVKAWITAFMYFSCNVSFSSLPVFLPTILIDLGFTSINAQGLTAPPYFLSFLVTCASSWIADRTQQRGLVLICLTIIGGVGYVILATVQSNGVRYFAIFLVASGVFPAIANILPWVLNNQGSDSGRGTGIALLNYVGQCGPLLGTRMYPASQSPRYVTGHSVCAAFMFFTTLLAISLRTLLAWENRKLDKKWGTVEEQRARAASQLSEKAEASQLDEKAEASQLGELGEKAETTVAGEENYGPMFRYIL